MTKLIGSEKQIAWAEEIISNARESLANSSFHANDRYAMAVEQGWDLAQEKAILDARQTIIKITTDYLDNATSASEIINNRGDLRGIAFQRAVTPGNIPDALQVVTKYIDRSQFKDAILHYS